MFGDFPDIAIVRKFLLILSISKFTFHGDVHLSALE